MRLASLHFLTSGRNSVVPSQLALPPSLDLVLEEKSENLGESLNGKAQLVLKSQIHLEIAFRKQVPGRAHAEERAAWRPPEGALGCLNLNN